MNQIWLTIQEALPGEGGGGPVAMWPREVVSCCDFILRSVATF